LQAERQNQQNRGQAGPGPARRGPGSRTEFSDAKDLIKERLDIVAFIGEQIPLKRAGQNHQALCPFHNEKTPSFVIFDASQHFRCFGCGKSGDIISFVMEREQVGFMEALRQLAERAGVELPETSGADRRERSLRADHMEVLGLTQGFFVEALAGHTACRQYVCDRGMEVAIGRFGLGHAPGPAGTGSFHQLTWPLVQFLLSKQVPLDMAVELGLLGRTQAGQYYDRFRHRLMFPIQDERGRVVGFGGRILPGHESDKEPKYLNSPESPVFNKRRLLFGLHQARKAETQELFVMEGYTDVIAAHLAGLTGAVATQGTSLTSDHAALLRRYAREGATLVFDGDRAGRQAAERGYKALANEVIPARICLLPEGLDPADLILGSEEGPEAFREELSKGGEALETYVDLLSARLDFGTREGKMSAAEECRQILAQVQDRMRRHDLAARMARQLILPAEHLLSRLPRARSRAEEGRLQRTESGHGEGSTAPQRPQDPVWKVQETLLEVLLKEPSLLVELEELWPGEEFCLPDPWTRDLVEVLREEVLSGGDFPSADRLMQLWMSHANGDSERSRWLTDLYMGAQALEEPRAQLLDGVRFVEEYRNQLQIQEVREKIRKIRRAVTREAALAQEGREGAAAREAEIRDLEIHLNRLMKSSSSRRASTESPIPES